MKKIFAAFLFITVVVATITGCKKIIRKIFQGIDEDVPAVAVTIPAIPIALPFEVPLGRFTQHFNLDSAVKATTGGTFSASDVTSIKIKQIVFDLSNADAENNISNFKSVRVLFSSNTKADTVTIASITFPDTYAASYTYIPQNSPELRPYLNGTDFYYDVFGEVRRVTTKPLDMSIKVTLRVE